MAAPKDGVIVVAPPNKDPEPPKTVEAGLADVAVANDVDPNVDVVELESPLVVAADADPNTVPPKVEVVEVEAVVPVEANMDPGDPNVDPGALGAEKADAELAEVAPNIEADASVLEASGVPNNDLMELAETFGGGAPKPEVMLEDVADENPKPEAGFGAVAVVVVTGEKLKDEEVPNPEEVTSENEIKLKRGPFALKEEFLLLAANDVDPNPGEAVLVVDSALSKMDGDGFEPWLVSKFKDCLAAGLGTVVSVIFRDSTSTLLFGGFLVTDSDLDFDSSGSGLTTVVPLRCK